MDSTVIESVALGGAADLSMWSLFLRADFVVKLVMVMLAAASFWSWAIIFDKVIRLRRLFGRADQFEESFWSGGSLEELYDRIGSRPLDPMASIFVAAMREWRRSAARGKGDHSTMRTGLSQRIDRVMQVTLAARWRCWNPGWASLRPSVPLLPSSVSSAPSGAS